MSCAKPQQPPTVVATDATHVTYYRHVMLHYKHNMIFFLDLYKVVLPKLNHDAFTTLIIINHVLQCFSAVRHIKTLKGTLCVAMRRRGP